MPYNVLTETGATVIATSGLGTPLTNTGETLLSLRTELLLALGNRNEVTAARANGWINWAYIDLASSLDLDDLKGSLAFSTVAASYRYKLPVEVMSTRGLSTIDTVTYGSLGGTPLRKIELHAYRLRSELSDEPTEYFREKNLLILWPTPKAVRSMALDFWIRPTYMTADTHSPVLPQEWHEAIFLNARKKGFVALQEYDKALAAENDFVQLVRRKQDRDEQEDKGRVVLSSVPKRRGQLTRRRSFDSDSPANLDLG